MFIMIAPFVSTAWPLLVPAAVAAAGLMGFIKAADPGEKGWLHSALTKKMMNKNKTRRTVALPLHQLIKDNISPELDREERLEFRKDDLILIFRKDTRGQFFAEIEGPSTFTEKELRRMIDEFMRHIVQQFGYNKLVKELELRGVNVVEEEINEEGEIVLQTRKWN